MSSRSCCGCCVCIHTSDLGMKESMGKFVGVAEPGCSCLNPFTESIAGIISLRVKPLKFTVESKTRDNVIVDVLMAVHYQVIPERAMSAHYKFSNSAQSITAFASNVIRGQVPIHTLDEIFLLKDEMAKAVKDELDHNMGEYGFRIVSTLILDIDPNNQIKHAMNMINTNARLRVAAGHTSEANKIEIIKGAEADAESKRLSGVGLAEQRKAVILGLQTSVENFKESVPGITSKDIMTLLLMNQYFDTVKDIVHHGRSAVVFTSDSGGDNVKEGMMSAMAGMPKPRPVMR
jgi:regulator of protease activity HflC (stomatin/prohibitin superfamily)